MQRSLWRRRSSLETFHIYNLMFKRPIPRPPRLPEKEQQQAPPPWIFSVPELIPKAYVPIYVPGPPTPRPPPVVARPFPHHLHAVHQKFGVHLPPLKSVCDAMRLDGYSAEKIKKVRDHYAFMRRTDDKRQRDIDRIFGTVKTVKRVVVKILKKRI